MMKHIFLLTLLASFLFVGNLKALTDTKSDAFTIYETPHPIPTATFYAPDGKTLSLTDYAGDVLVVNFWKPNCRLCLIELPALDKLQADYKDKGVRVIAIAQESDISKITEALLTRRLKNIEPFYDTDERVLKAVGGQKVPRTILIDKAGKEVGYIQGLANFHAPSLREQIDALF